MSDACEHSTGGKGEHGSKPLDSLSAAGPLGRLLRAQFAETPAQGSPKKQGPKEKRGRGPRLQVKNAGEDSTGLEQANSLVVLRQAAFVNTDGPSVELPPEAEQALLRWAQSPTGGRGSDTHGFSHGLGQETDHLKHAAERRTYGMRRLRTQGKSVIRVRLTPEWRMIVGHGERANAYEIGITLHGTYGWPVIPGSGLKGLASAFARVCGDELRTHDSDGSGAGPEKPEELRKFLRDYRGVFGTELFPEEEEKWSAPEECEMDDVRFLDAFPDGKPATTWRSMYSPRTRSRITTTRFRKTPAAITFFRGDTTNRSPFSSLPSPRERSWPTWSGTTST